MNDTKSPPSKHLNSIDVPILSRTNCISHFDTHNGTQLDDKKLFWKKMLCGGSKNPNIGNNSCPKYLSPKRTPHFRPQLTLIKRYYDVVLSFRNPVGKKNSRRSVFLLIRHSITVPYLSKIHSYRLLFCNVM